MRADVASSQVKLKGLQDRVAALDGHIHVTRNNRTSRVELELPVVSLATPCAAPMNGADT